MRPTLALAALAGLVAAKEQRTFAVLRFYGDGPLVTTRLDPIVNPGVISPHVHMVMGASNFASTVTGESLRQSKCTNALIAEDLSNYWVPQLYFQDPGTKKFEKVELFYMNVYYL